MREPRFDEGETDRLERLLVPLAFGKWSFSLEQNGFLECATPALPANTVLTLREISTAILPLSLSLSKNSLYVLVWRGNVALVDLNGWIFSFFNSEFQIFLCLCDIYLLWITLARLWGFYGTQIHVDDISCLVLLLFSFLVRGGEKNTWKKIIGVMNPLYGNILKWPKWACVQIFAHLGDPVPA